MEGAWLLKRNGTYYLTYSAGGTENRTYCVGCLTSKSPLGPFTPQKNNPILRGTAGLVTLEDLLEEIVGEVSDAFEARLPAIQPQPDGSSLIDGLALIEEINEHFGLQLSDPNYDTIAGYVLGKLGRIPQVGDVVRVWSPQLGLLANRARNTNLAVCRSLLGTTSAAPRNPTETRDDDQPAICPTCKTGRLRLIATLAPVVPSQPHREPLPAPDTS